MELTQILTELENAIDENWGYKFNGWMHSDAAVAIQTIYVQALPYNPSNSILGRNLYYAMESYVYFTENPLKKDILVFLDRIIQKQLKG